MTDPTPAEHPTLDGDLYIFSDEDLSQISGEVCARAREIEGLDEHQAEQTATLVHDLLTGDWLADPTE